MENWGQVDSWSMCRLCAADHRGGRSLFTGSEPLADLINRYLPLRIKDDDKLPSKICPGCNIQLEATIQFLDLIVTGQTTLNEYLKKQSDSQKFDILSNDEAILIQVSEDGHIYTTDHNISLKLQGLTAPKKKRGRPKKPIEQNKTAENVTDENVILDDNQVTDIIEAIESDCKRRRYAPRKFDDLIIQGDELKKILCEEGVTDDESDKEPKRNSHKISNNLEETIDDMKYANDINMEKIIPDKTVVKKKRVRGPAIKQTCSICSLKFNILKEYMSHMAIHSRELELQQSHQIITNEPIPTNLESLPLADTSIDMVNLGVNSEASYFVTGPSMPDISSEIIESEPINKNGVSLLINSNENIFPEPTIGDPVSELITSSILPIATMPPEEMSKKTTKPPITEQAIEELESEFDELKCKECGKTFNSTTTRDNHIKISHQGERKYHCPHCDKSFGYFIALKKHTLVHYPKSSRSFACDICGKVLRHPSSVVYHKETKHSNDNNFVCNKCNKVFKHPQLLRRHQLIHMEDKPFVCKTCGTSFKTKSNLINHQRVHVGIKKFKCDVCNQHFTHKNTLNTHYLSHTDEKPHHCNVCGKNFRQKSHLTVHLKTHTGEKTFVCTICSKKFATSSQCQAHLKRHVVPHNNDKELLNRTDWNSGSDETYPCSVCLKIFNKRSALQKHAKLHEKEKSFGCDYCDKTFSNSVALSNHKKTHIFGEESRVNENQVQLDEATDSILECQNAVLCVTYNNNDADAPPEFHIVNENDIQNLNTCALYETQNELLMDNNIPIASIPEVQNSNTIFDHFVDEDGNTIQFELQEGTQFTISALPNDKFLQVKNHDFILDDNTSMINPSTEILDTTKIADTSQTVQFITNNDDNALSQYLTIP